MTNILVALLMVSLAAVFCVRHFFIQLIAIKLLIDTLIVLLCSVQTVVQDAADVQTAAVIILSMSTLVFFVILASGIQRFARAKDLDLGSSGD